jgi:hypothetical protein
MKFLLNISTHPGDQAIIRHDWDNARGLLLAEGFDGYELYPVGTHAWETIPTGLMLGMHLRFYPILKPLWVEDTRRLMEIFGDKQTVSAFYGGPDRDALVENYRWQLSLAHDLGCAYVVFHLAQSEFDYIYDWQFPWNWRETIDLCAELLNSVLINSPFHGLLLLENLWWPGSFRALDPEEIFYALSHISYPNTGMVLDTGHLLNTNQDLVTEAQGIEFLVDSIRLLGEARQAIRGVHLTKSLSSEYVKHTRMLPPPVDGAFWDRYHQAIRHVTRIDEHDPFEDLSITRLFDLIDPDYVTYEFTYASREEWRDKIHRQRKAMARLHPVASENARRWRLNGEKG